MARWFNWACLGMFLVASVFGILVAHMQPVTALLTYAGIYGSMCLSGWLVFWTLRFLIRKFPHKFDWVVIRVIYIFIAFFISYGILTGLWQWIFNIRIV